MERAENVINYVKAHLRDIDYENMTLEEVRKEGMTFARMTGMDEEEGGRHTRGLIEEWYKVHGKNKGRKAGASSEKPND